MTGRPSFRPGARGVLQLEDGGAMRLRRTSSPAAVGVSTGHVFVHDMTHVHGGYDDIHGGDDGGGGGRQSVGAEQERWPADLSPAEAKASLGSAAFARPTLVDRAACYAARCDAIHLEIPGPCFESLDGKRQSFVGGRFGKPCTRRSTGVSGYAGCRQARRASQPARPAAAAMTQGRAVGSAGRAAGVAQVAQGSVALSLCAVVHPLLVYTRFTENLGASISETATQPDPTGRTEPRGRAAAGGPRRR
jgi:hypothetical protein